MTGLTGSADLLDQLNDLLDLLAHLLDLLAHLLDDLLDLLGRLTGLGGLGGLELHALLLVQRVIGSGLQRCTPRDDSQGRGGYRGGSPRPQPLLDSLLRVVS
ncbi:MAG: hypothetical protein ACRDRP_23735 [Pseudonocardiaceae bacterium]